MKQKITGPYKVKLEAGEFCIMRELVQGRLQPLDPPVSYKNRQNAYRRAVSLNRAWQERMQGIQEASDKDL